MSVNPNSTQSSQIDALFTPGLVAAQQPNWPDKDALAKAVEQLRTFPPLVFAGECDTLKEKIAEAAEGRAFWLQGGDCAETFAGATADSIRNRMKTILQMAAVLQYGASLPVLKVGRMAGQFAKPRSNDNETRGDVTLPAYRGDAVNDLEFTLESRTPDPQRLVRVYQTSVSTLNLVRAFTHGGFADLRRVHEWNKGFIRDSAVGERYEQMANEIGRALAFMHSAGVDPDAFRSVDLYSSHEALILEYERALTRIDSRTQEPYDVSAHFVWIGERTRKIDGAHVDFCSKIRNPIGVKLGPKTQVDEVLALIEKLDPNREPGRLTFITRMGAGVVREALPKLVDGVTKSGAKVLWVCDPMHGNTYEAPSGYKTRKFDDVLDEVRGFFEVHKKLGTHPGGIHIELTGDDVTECVGGGEQISHDDLSSRYETACDPRLNHTQSLELAFLVAEMLRDRQPFAVLSTSSIKSPIGTLVWIADNDLVLAAGFSTLSELFLKLSKEDKEREIKSSKAVGKVADLISAYFDGELDALNAIEVRQPGSHFSQAAWKAMRKIKSGKVISYADLAQRSGSPAAVRAAGTACGRNAVAPIVPCHRIVKTGGALGNYGYGISKKEWLLKHEGAI